MGDTNISDTLTLGSGSSISASALNSGTLGNLGLTLALGSFGSITGSITDSNISDLITVSNYLPLSGGTLTGNLGINGGNLTTTATTFNIDVGNTGSIVFRDGSNTLFSIADGGSTGNLSINGNFDMSSSAGTFYTGTGAITLAGNTTISSGKTLSVTTADNLTVGGSIVPQTLFVSVNLLSSLLDNTVFIADANYSLTSVKCVYSVKALLLGTLQLTVDTGTQSPGSGTSQLTSNINLSGTINTVVSGTLISSPTTIAAGDRVSVDLGGTLTGLFGSCTIGVKRI
ncbi:MAG: hypothetical protein WD231_01290 [Candidatus Woykebacteria bacterium]